MQDARTCTTLSKWFTRRGQRREEVGFKADRPLPVFFPYKIWAFLWSAIDPLINNSVSGWNMNTNKIPDSVTWSNFFETHHGVFLADRGDHRFQVWHRPVHTILRSRRFFGYEIPHNIYLYLYRGGSFCEIRWLVLSLRIRPTETGTHRYAETKGPFLVLSLDVNAMAI